MKLTPEENEMLDFALLAQTEEGRQKLIEYLVPAQYMPADPEGLALLHNSVLAAACTCVDALNELADFRKTLNQSERTPCNE